MNAAQVFSLPTFQKEYCLHLLDKLEKMPISYPFRQLGSNQKPNYSDIVKQPMDLALIRKKLENDEYKDYIEWGSDVRLVWFNAQTYFAKGTPENTMALTLSDWFEPRFQDFPRFPVELWLKKLKTLQKKMKKLVTTSPIVKGLLPEIPKGKE